MKLRAFSCLLPLVVAACGAGSEESGTSSNDVTVTPEGPGGDVTITVVVPDEVNQPTWQWFTNGDPSSKHLRYYYGKTELKPGVATRARHQPDSQGFSWITITYGDGDVAARQLSYSDRFMINQGESQTLTLGAVQILGWLPNAPAMQLTPYAPSEGLSTVWGGQLWAKWRPSSPAANGWWWAAKGGPILPVFAGSYEWSRGVADPISLDVTAGKLTSIDTSIADPFTYVKVNVAGGKAFPDGQAAKYSVTCKGESGNWQTVSLDPNQLATSVYLKAQTDCTWSAGAQSIGTFTLEPSKNVTVQTARLEVDDVTLTDEPKGTKVHGFYMVQQNWQGGRRDVSGTWLPTKTGLDVPPGSYHLWIKYASPQGQPQQIEQDVDVQ